MFLNKIKFLYEESIYLMCKEHKFSDYGIVYP